MGTQHECFCFKSGYHDLDKEKKTIFLKENKDVHSFFNINV